MPKYESITKAVKKYKEKNVKRIAFDVNMATQPNLYKYLTEDVDNVQGYIRNLIYEDMKKQCKEID